MKIKLSISCLLMITALPAMAHSENSLSLSAQWQAHLLLAGSIFGIILALSFGVRCLLQNRL